MIKTGKQHTDGLRDGRSVFIDGALVNDVTTLRPFAVRSRLSRRGKFVTTLRELAGGGMIMLPSSVKDYANPEIASLIERIQQSPAASAEEKVKFDKLAWDAVGSEVRLSTHAVRDVLCGRRFRRQRALIPDVRLGECGLFG